MPVGRALYGGSPYLGVYLRVGEDWGIAPPALDPELQSVLSRLFHIRVLRTTVFDCEVVGSLVALNSHGLVVAEGVRPEEADALSEAAPLSIIDARLNALGNNVLANDFGALVNPELSDRAVRAIARALDVPVRRATIAGMGTVGMAGLATNRGVVLHPRASPREAEVAGEILQVPVHRSTANFGVPVVGACAVANSRSLLIGRPTTPVEMVHLEEGLSIAE